VRKYIGRNTYVQAMLIILLLYLMVKLYTKRGKL
jgi:hypothetical protein